MRPVDAPQTTSDLSDEERLALKQARTISVALIVGVVLFSGVVGGVSMTAKGQPAPAGGAVSTAPLLAGAAALMLVGALPVAAVLRTRMRAAGVDPRTRRVDPMKFVTLSLIVMALLEAPALLAVVSCLVGKSMWPGGAVALAAVLAMIAFLPRAQHFATPGVATGPRNGVSGYREPEKWK